MIIKVNISDRYFFIASQVCVLLTHALQPTYTAVNVLSSGKAVTFLFVLRLLLLFVHTETIFNKSSSVPTEPADTLYITLFFQFHLCC